MEQRVLTCPKIGANILNFVFFHKNKVCHRVSNCFKTLKLKIFVIRCLRDNPFSLRTPFFMMYITFIKTPPSFKNDVKVF